MPRFTWKNFADRGIPVLLSLPLGLLSAVLLHFALNVGLVYKNFLEGQSERFQSVYLSEGIAGLVNTSCVLAGLGCAFFFAVFVFTLFFKKPLSLSLIRKAYAVFYGYAVFYAFMVLRITGIILEYDLKIDELDQDKLTVFYMRFDLIWHVLLMLAVFVFLHVFAWRRRVINLYYGLKTDTPAKGDLILENVRSHGRDPLFRKSMITSSLMHFLAIVLPLILSRIPGCVEPYKVPKGEDQVLSIVQVVQPEKPPKRRHVLNPQSAISFHIPDLDDSELLKEVEQITQLQHVADPTSVHAKQTTGGRKTGWPDGAEDAVFRFIRLQHGGPGWNDGMDPVTAADINFLNEFRRATGFRVAKQSESHPISALARYPKGFAPPFVYLTGDGHLRVSRSEMDVLRRYLTDGGMLFVDCASRTFDRSFRSFIRLLFPGEELRVIADDDPIFQTPFVFPHGAPPLWHHGGTRAMGVRRGNRWMVFYHPGELKDAWKTGHTGVRPEIARQAYQMGINVVFHAFTHYMNATRKYRR